MAAIIICSDFGAQRKKVCHCFHCFPIYLPWSDGTRCHDLRFLKEMEIPDHLTCLLRNLYAGQEATVRTGHGTTDWFQIGKAVHQGCILSPCLFNLYAEYIMRNAGLEEKKLESRLLGKISITSDMQMIPPLCQKVKRNQKASWWKWSREWKSWLKAQHSENEYYGIRSHHFMGNRWGNSGNSVRLYFLGLQNHCRWWLQPWN